MAARRSRKRRRQRARRATPERARPPAPERARSEPVATGYARARQKDEEARARLEPLAPGERPGAVTVAAVVAAVLALANLGALVARFDSGEPEKSVVTVLGAGILLLVAWGMWRVRYWAVLGMQTILALAIIGSALALLSAANIAALALVIAILAGAGTLFWFLVKAMARIQMPKPPSAR